MKREGEQIDLDFENEDAKLRLSSGFTDLIGHIEGSLPEAHLHTLLAHKAEEVLGGLSPEQDEAITRYLETHASYSKIVPIDLASEILDIAA
ncbi:MAG: hypothetical protein WC495_01870 [Patescibacteria group bacterium]|jgi:predicted DNA-binding protein with PD1-like motif